MKLPTIDPTAFLELIESLPAEGDTALLTRQTPVKADDGSLQYHADGVVKATFPAFTPAGARKRMKKGDAWYVNTGSFVMERMTDKISASRQNCDYVLFMMLDDIGTKSKEPDLDPTWIMETSEGSFQWGFVFSEQPTKAEFSAAIRAIAKAGYTDPGAVNAVRNCRIPGSVNLKKGRNGFEARITEWNPDVEYTLDEICEALGVEIGEVDESEIETIKLKDTGGDVVLQWLSDGNLVLEHANGEGWYGVVCPNFQSHSDGNPEARYHPVNRSFCCYHGHCQDITSTDYLGWIAENGGPAVQHGTRDDLLADRLKSTMEKADLQPNDMFTNRAEEVVKAAQAAELARVEQTAWFERFAYVRSDDAYFDLETRALVTRREFNALFRGYRCRSIHNEKKTIEASTWFDERRSQYQALALKGVLYAAGEQNIVVQAGEYFGNTWVDARPEIEAANVKDADVSLWLDHCRTLVPDEAELEHCLNVMAFRVQNPAVKINHAVLHGGDEGSGKDTMWAPMLWAIGGRLQRNIEIVDAQMLANDHCEGFESEVMILNELREPEAAQRRALADRLKPVIAAPPATLTVNPKFVRPYKVLNRLFLLSFTNHPVPISLPSQDRRWFCVWSRTGRLSEDQAKRIWAWYNDGGFETITAWLKQRDVSAFNPAGFPISTEWHQSMIENGRSGAESVLVDMIRDCQGPFANGAAGAPWHALIGHIRGTGIIEPDVKLPQQALLHSFKEAGWVEMGRIASADYPNKKQIFARPDLAASMSKSELRRLIEQPVMASKLKLVA